MEITVPKEVIETHIKSAVLAAIGDPETVVKAVIDTALEKKRQNYGRGETTVLGDIVDSEIENVARRAVSEVFNSLEERIREGIKARMLSEDFANKIADQVIESLAGDIAIDIRLGPHDKYR